MITTLKDLCSIFTNMNFRDWLYSNYDEANNLYYYIIKYVQVNRNQKRIFDKLEKEDFFIFIYRNTMNKY
jgi:hypothetical protein